jgi:hypothetical protein
MLSRKKGVPLIPCSCIAATFSRAKPNANIMKHISAALILPFSLNSRAMKNRTNKRRKLINLHFSPKINQSNRLFTSSNPGRNGLKVLSVYERMSKLEKYYDNRNKPIMVKKWCFVRIIKMSWRSLVCLNEMMINPLYNVKSRELINTSDKMERAL